jgi:pimeloyl-ACP methyl ester carboxylesterase
VPWTGGRLTTDSSQAGDFSMTRAIQKSAEMASNHHSAKASQRKEQARGGPDVLPEAVDAPRADVVMEGGWRLAYYAERSAPGRPLVLVHSINAAPSSFEVKPLFDHYRSQRPVYSLDLPGFGHSERRPAGYTPELYARALETFLEKVVGEPADLIALSLGAEFAARAIGSKPAAVASLVLISPTGFSRRVPPSPRVGRIAHKVLTIPVLSQALFDLVASKRSIAYYLGRSFVGKPPQATLDYAYATSHQPGARHAPLVFLSMQLFTPDAIDRLYAKLTDLPVLAIADRDPYIDFDHLDDFVAQHPNWSRLRLEPNMGLPQWERLPETIAALDAFWADRRL